MFCFLFGWRKTSKCKSVVKQLQCRLKLLKNKKYAISSHLRNDIAQLLRIGERDRALHRAQQLFLDENLMSLYHLLLHFSDIILFNLSYIRRHRDLPDGINEAVSTLVFASARCGDLPELRALRILFDDRYGKHFVDTALNLLPCNRVNPQVIEKLSIITVSDDAKSKLLGEIAEEYNLRLEVLALEYTPEFHKQVKESEYVEEEKEVMGTDSAQPPCASQKADSETEVYKFTLTDADTEEKQAQQSRSKALSDEDDCIEEEVVEKDQSVFRFIETEEEKRERKRSRRKSRSSSSSPIAKDVDCWRYYYKGKRSRQKKECGKCYHIVYNVFTMLPDQKESEEGERSLKKAMHVHPKLPDYDQIVAHFTALRKQHHQQQKHMRSR
ncbi:Vacuolar protein sorting-associated protein Ist1 [Arabidopsis suecica]|uniref:Vacuolar protein sorting-associated protein Ist1 n=1 Tax=Arabidopsis suecica TaxID=45249 RepID=A0A8T2B9P2_ARASU|nr:Vacuolar protein sorting-associated protein Ist1 [Arabidopsis suecica]